MNRHSAPSHSAAARQKRLGCRSQGALRVGLSLAALLALVAAPRLTAEPQIVFTFEGQLGTVPDPGTDLSSWVFFAATTDVEFTLRVTDTISGELVDLEKDAAHATNPTEIDERPTSHSDVAKTAPPASAEWIGSGNLAGVFSFTEDGSTSGTEAVVVALVPNGLGSVTYVVLDNVPTFFFPDESFNKTAVTADADGDIALFFTEFTGSPPNQVPKVRGQRIDSSGSFVGDVFDITGDLHTAPDAALLDPNGDVIVVPTVEFEASVISIKGNLIDFTGPSPVVLPEFPINTTSGFNGRPAVAADPSTGAFVVVWDNVVDLPGDPVNVRARRFDADGNPVGADFVVNTTTANAQGQPDVDVGPNGEAVVVWAGDSGSPGLYLDVFAQAYDAAGQPIGGEIRVNSTTDGVQDRPTVRFLPDPDSQGRVQFAVAWRDVASDVDDTPNGTGVGIKCFSIDDPQQIFADGFESGDTSSWSSSTPN